MSSFEIQFNGYTIALSLSIKSLYISALNVVNYDFYCLDIDKVVFNNDNISFTQLFNIIRNGLMLKNNIKIDIKLMTNKLNLSVFMNNDFVLLDRVFELVKQNNQNTSTIELKKQIYKLNTEIVELKRMLNICDEQNIKYPRIISDNYDEKQIEKQYGPFLDKIYEFINTKIKNCIQYNSSYNMYEIDPSNANEEWCIRNLGISKSTYWDLFIENKESVMNMHIKQYLYYRNIEFIHINHGFGTAYPKIYIQIKILPSLINCK